MNKMGKGIRYHYLALRYEEFQEAWELFLVSDRLYRSVHEARVACRAAFKAFMQREIPHQSHRARLVWHEGADRHGAPDREYDTILSLVASSIAGFYEEEELPGTTYIVVLRIKKRGRRAGSSAPAAAAAAGEMPPDPPAGGAGRETGRKRRRLE